MAAEDEGNLASDEFGFFVLLLAVAGNETTRNAITHGMHAFLTHPDQWELYKRERPATAAEEIVRWATPVVSFQRTATQDTELGGQQIRKGDRVGIFYSSANNDPEVFDDPDAFDITRDPNPHLGFGGGGPHFCLGKSLAVLEIDLIFNAIADAMPDLRLVGDPRRLRSAWLNGVKELQVSTSSGRRTLGPTASRHRRPVPREAGASPRAPPLPPPAQLGVRLVAGTGFLAPASTGSIGARGRGPWRMWVSRSRRRPPPRRRRRPAPSGCRWPRSRRP